MTFSSRPAVGLDGGIAGGGDDPLVGGQQVIGVGMEVRDAADHGCTGNEVVAVDQEIRQEIDIPSITFDEAVPGMVVIRPADRAVLGIVVDADHVMATIQQLLDHVATDESGRSSHQNGAHGILPRSAASRIWSRARRGPKANRHQRK